MRKSCFAHAANGHQSASDGNFFVLVVCKIAYYFFGIRTAFKAIGKRIDITINNLLQLHTSITHDLIKIVVFILCFYSIQIDAIISIIIYIRLLVNLLYLKQQFLIFVFFQLSKTQYISNLAIVYFFPSRISYSSCLPIQNQRTPSGILTANTL